MLRGVASFLLAFSTALSLPVAVFAQGQGEVIVAARTLRAGTVLGPGDIRLATVTAAGAISDPGQAIGQETRIAIYAGRAIFPGDLAPPALVDRNQIVRLVFRSGALSISAEGRSLGRASEGETVRVMNLSSRNTVTGIVSADGAVHVLGAP